jgi:hypothetical protein
MISLSQGRYLHTGQHKQCKITQTFMPRVGFEPTIVVFERAKTVLHALERAANVIDVRGDAFMRKHISSPLLTCKEFGLFFFFLLFSDMNIIPAQTAALREFNCISTARVYWHDRYMMVKL